MLTVIKQNYGSFKTIMTMPKNPDGYKGRLLFDEPMSRHTSWRVGGTADRFYIPNDLVDLQLFLASVEDDEAITWIGLGSNLLVRDGGIRGTVIAIKNMENRIDLIAATEIHAGAGISCARLAKYSVKAGLSGAEFLVGIPGTLGGALAMNAGAFGSETWDIVHSVTTIDRKGKVLVRDKGDYSTGYRSVSKPAGEWFISANISLMADVNHSGQGKLRDFLNKRNATQPVGTASCGSVFKNPENAEPAAKLIDKCGLKGKCIGNACVSEKHANFIINTGKARAKDIENLIEYVQETVFKQFKVRLIPEVQITGEND